MDLMLAQLRVMGALIDCPDPLRLAAVAAEPDDLCYRQTVTQLGFDPLLDELTAPRR